MMMIAIINHLLLFLLFIDVSKTYRYSATLPLYYLFPCTAKAIFSCVSSLLEISKQAPAMSLNICLGSVVLRTSAPNSVIKISLYKL